MRILAVDTTTGSASAAVVEDGRLRAEIGADVFGTQSTRLLASIEILLASLGLSPRDFDGFAVTPGPGSFTGIRIGLSTIQALAFASEKPIAPVSSLEALAWKERSVQETISLFVCPILDAKKGEAYGALFESRGKRMEEIVPQGNYAPERFLGLLPKARDILFIGNGTAVFGQAIRARFKKRARFSGRSLFIAPEVGLLGAEILSAGKGVGPEALEPLYFRRSQAEDGR
jgi:tRNA threonylcarbamoyladenosine biosynthesis protein TsaB